MDNEGNGSATFAAIVIAAVAGLNGGLMLSDRAHTYVFQPAA